jgi:hypothetical protein
MDEKMGGSLLLPGQSPRGGNSLTILTVTPVDGIDSYSRQTSPFSLSTDFAPISVLRVLQESSPYEVGPEYV